MARWRACAAIVSLAWAGVAWSASARAQSDLPDAPADAAPPTEAPAAPPTEAPAAPPTEAPAAPPTEAPAAPPPAAPPAEGAFPTPPTVAPPAAAAAPVVLAPPPPAPTPPARASEGLFEEKRPLPTGQDVREGDKNKTDQFKIGVLLGTGAPSLLSIGGALKVTRYLGAGVDLGLIPRVALKYYGEATLSYQHLDFYGRVYPFGGGFFLGAGLGYASIEATVSTQVDTRTYSAGLIPYVQYDGAGSVKTLVLNALIGYLYVTDIGFTIGVDAGARIPIAASDVTFSRSTTPPVCSTGASTACIPSQLADVYLGPTDKEVLDALELLGRTTLPTLNLRIGWML